MGSAPAASSVLTLFQYQVLVLGFVFMSFAIVSRQHDQFVIFHFPRLRRSTSREDNTASLQCLSPLCVWHFCLSSSHVMVSFFEKTILQYPSKYKRKTAALNRFYDGSDCLMLNSCTSGRCLRVVKKLLHPPYMLYSGRSLGVVEKMPLFIR